MDNSKFSQEDIESSHQIFDFISQIDPFDKFSTKLTLQVAKRLRNYSLKANESIEADILAEGYLFIVKDGAIEQREINGNMRSKLGKGEIFGYSMLVEEIEENFTAKAIEDSNLYMLAYDAYQQLCENTEFANLLASKIKHRLKYALNFALKTDNTSLLSKVENIILENTVKADVKTSIKDVARQMIEQNSSSAVILDKDIFSGLVTHKDLTAKVILNQISPDDNIASIMVKNPPFIDASLTAMEAISKMIQFNTLYLPVLKDKEVVGVVNPGDIVYKHISQSLYLIEAITKQSTVEDVIKVVNSQKQSVFEYLIQAGTRPEQISRSMTLILDTVSKKLIELSISELGQPPCDFAWIAAGSQARYDIQIKSDQDNAIILAKQIKEDKLEYFHKLSVIVCDALNQCGYKFCPGNIMAKNPRWCQPINVWKEYYLNWISTSDADSLLYLSVFFDIRCVYGEQDYVSTLNTYITELTSKNRRFLTLLMQVSLLDSPPIGFFRSFVVARSGENKNTFNIKKRGVKPIVDLARAYALMSEKINLGASVEERLQSAVEANIISESNFEDLVSAYHYICLVRLRHQLETIRKGNIVDNYVSPDSLNQFDRNHLKDAFRIIVKAQDSARFLHSGQLPLR